MSNSIRSAMSDIEDQIAANQMNAAQVFTAMRQLVRRQAAIPAAKSPSDGAGDEDSYNRGWNDYRAAMLSAAPAQGKV